MSSIGDMQTELRVITVRTFLLCGIKNRPSYCTNPTKGQFHVKSISQSLKNLTIFNFAQILHANSHPQEKQLCKILEKSVKYFSSYAPPKNGNFTPKIGVDRYVASISYQ